MKKNPKSPKNWKVEKKNQVECKRENKSIKIILCPILLEQTSGSYPPNPPIDNYWTLF